MWQSLSRKIVVPISGFERFETYEAIINQLSSSQEGFKLSSFVWLKQFNGELLLWFSLTFSDSLDNQSISVSI